ncbi:MAG: tetratricopeptide repeat protein [Candidatus Eremiobacteraeota bacterium]|nr:tetratricopeptide repeat protein [Candidatus Eremiobacteraeota bacterium]
MRGQHGVDTRVSFVARTRELERLGELLDAGECAVLVGAGGVGKSRLALEAAQHWEARTGREAVFVRLAGVAAEAVAGTVAEALGVRPESGGSLLDALAAPSPVASGLVVLDNCEDEPRAIRDAIERLRARGETAVLATSRAPLNIGGEATIDVEPFDRVDGSAFFRARAKLANVDLDPSGRDANAVATIVERCDGLAVAIDLAAARLATLSVEALKDELAQPRPYHFRSNASDVPRHRTLNRLVDWSLAKLDETARTVFALAGRFGRTFSSDDVAALMPASDRDATFALEELADQSLLVRSPERDGTYWMLAPIRAVAKRRLDKILDRRGIEECFAQHLGARAAALIRRLDEERAVDLMRAVAERYEDYTSVLGWALSEPKQRLADLLEVFALLGWLWTDGGRFGEGQLWCDRMLAACHVLEPLQRGRVEYLALRVAYVAADYDRMLALGPQLVTTFSVGGDRLGLARAYNGLAVASIFTGRFSEAKTYADTSLALYGALKHDAGIAAALINQGSIALEGHEDPITARARFEEALEIATRLGRDATVALAYGNLAEAAYAVHDASATEKYARSALESFERTGDESRKVWPLVTLARASLMRYERSADRRQLESAARDLTAALSLCERAAHPDYLALGLETAARLLSHAHASTAAATIGFAAQRLRRERHVPAFGLTLREAREEMARLELELTLDQRRDAIRDAEANSPGDLPALALGALATITPPPPEPVKDRAAE